MNSTRMNAGLMGYLKNCNQFIIIIMIIMFVSNQVNAELSYSEVNLAESVSIISQTETSINLKFEIPTYKRSIVSSGDNGDRIRYVEPNINNPVIAPDIPVITKLFIIPDGMNAEVNITHIETKLESNFSPVGIPALNQWKDLDENRDEFADRVWNKYFKSKHNQSPIQLDKPVIMRNYRLLPVAIHPFIYNQDSHELRIIEKIEFELTFFPDHSIDRNIGGNKNPTPSRYIDKIIGNLVVNPPPMRDDEVSGGAIAYIIGDWDDVAEAIIPLIEWRRKMGWTVDVIRVAANENMDRQVVKQAILDAYNDWEITPEYVVLVGDAPGMQNNPYNIAFWNMQNGANTAYESDHPYTMLVGDDIFPEVAIGRLVFNSVNMLEGQIEKIISYESNPYTPNRGEDQNWQIRAAVAATDSRSGKSSIDICRWFKYMLVENGYDQVDEFYWNNGNLQRNPRAFLNETIDRGVSFVLYRGWSHMNGYDPRDASRHRNGRMLPFVMLATCNTGDYGQNLLDPNWCYIERFAWSDIGGAIGAVGAAGATHTAYNNLFATSTMKAPFVDKIYSQGWATMAGKLELMKHYSGLGDIAHPENRGMEAWLTEFYIFNLMGDPAVDLYTAVPRILTVSHVDVLREGESKYSVQVNYDDNDSPASGARVCLYMPGEFQHVSYTNSDGEVDFRLDPADIQDGEVFLTVSGHNLMPYLYEIEIESVNYFLGATDYQIDDDNEGASRGDDDGVANPNENIELSIEVSNLGNRRPGGEVSIVLVPQSPHLGLDDDTVVIDSSPGQNESQYVEFVVNIGGGFPNGGTAKFDVVISANEMEWSSSITFPVDAAQLELYLFEWDDNDLMPSDTAAAIISIVNDGEKSTGELEGTLISLTSTIEVLEGNISFESVHAGDEIDADMPVIIAASKFHLNGTDADFALALEDINGFQDTTYFSIRIGRIRDNEPFGPDNYGYICVDNTAESFAIHPTFDWVEIDPNLGGDGTDTGIQDRGEEYDNSVVIDLPFEFVYYGESFDRLTICSNGWVAFGDYELLNSARNRHIPSGEVVPGMLCPFWDDLITLYDSGIYYWYDEQENRFIIEYSNLKKLGPRHFNEATETFEIILMDPEYIPTLTGDGDIIFQYLEVEDSRSAFQLWDTPYATVGIGSVDQTDGIEYTYWGQLHPGAAPLEPGRAIRFTTMTEYPTVPVSGRVFDAETGEPISGAKVRTSYGNITLSEDDGTFELSKIIFYDNYSFTASKEFYNSSTIAGIEVGPDQDNELVFRLNHPEFSLNRGELSLESVYVDSVSTTFQIENSGNGLLKFDSKIEFSSEADIWDQLGEIQAGDSTYGGNDNQIKGVVWVDGYWLVSGGGDGVIGENWFYKFSKHGRYLGRVSQQLESRYGIRDMEYAAGFVYGINSYSNVRQILKIDPETGDILRSWDVADQVRYLRAIAIDAENQKLYIAGTSSKIYEFEFRNDSTLALIDEHDIIDERTQSGVQPYGLGLYSEDPDGYNLYIYTSHNPEDNDDIPDISIYKVNTNDWSSYFVTGLEDLPATGRGRGGMCITPTWSEMNWVMAVVVDEPHQDIEDYIGIFELGHNTTWIDIEPMTGELLPQEAVDVEMILYTKNLGLGNYEFDLDYTFNAEPGSQTLPISVSVIVNIFDKSIAVPAEFSLMQNWPNPFNSTTSISFSLNSKQNINLSVIDPMGRLVENLIDDENRRAGQHTISFEASDFPAGIYFYRLQAGSQIAVKKMVMLK